MKKKRVDWLSVADELGLTLNGRGWYENEKLECPECNKAGKFGLLKKENDTGLVRCWKCGYADSIFNYLYKTNNYQFVSGGRKYDLATELDDKLLMEETVTELEETQLPVGFRRITKHPYLEGRGFTQADYERYEIGITNSPMEPKWKGRVIFQIFQNERRVALLGRSLKSKEWHDENLAAYREETGHLFTRYNNSDTNFNYILGGLDDININTRIVIIVEGLFDAVNVNNLLPVELRGSVAIVYTFGSSISVEQIKLLKTCKTVQKLILLYDPDSIIKQRHIVSDLQAEFEEVLIGGLPDDKDPGDISCKELTTILKELKTPDEFYTGTLIVKNLRNDE